MSQPYEEKRLFVYGSLMRGRPNYEKNLARAVERCVRARMRGAVYHLSGRGYPALTSGSGWVAGELLKLKRFRECIDALDAFEEFFGPEHPGNLYERMAVQVFPEDGGPEEAYAYVYARFDLDTPANPAVLLPEGDWGAYMDGLRTHGQF